MTATTIELRLLWSSRGLSAYRPVVYSPEEWRILSRLEHTLPLYCIEDLLYQLCKHNEHLRTCGKGLASCLGFIVTCRCSEHAVCKGVFSIDLFTCGN
jgi:hypothetical protein